MRAQLRHKHFQVKGVMVVQGASHDQPGGQTGRHPRHVDEGERNQQLGTPLQLPSLADRLPGDQPFVVIPGHTLGARLCAGGPADGEHIVGGDAHVVAVLAQLLGIPG